MEKSRLAKKYRDEIIPVLIKEFKIKNPLASPRIMKVVVNSGIGSFTKSKEMMETVEKDMATITGQKPSLRKARVSIANFNLREGMPVGIKATLRGDRMYSFLDKLFSISLPRLRDFRGVSLDSLDGNGNYTLGLEEHTIFPDLDLTKTTKPFGLEITFVTNTKNPDVAKRLLELLGMPFEKKDKEKQNDKE